MKVCTIAAKNYLAQVEVLAASFNAHHPSGKFAVLLIGHENEDDRSPGEKPYQIYGLNDIGLPPEEIGRMAMIYNVTEFSTAVKPWFLRKLLETGAPAVIYLDPDIEIFSPLDDIFELARRHAIVLTPHSVRPYPRDGFRLDESDILGAGVYNLGFLGLGSQSMDFLDWWSERLRRECVVDPAGMRFTDQRWIDFVPAMYDHYILKDEACNVAYWNLHGRKVVWTGGRYEVNGRPLRFFHFSGFDPDQPHLLSKHMADRPRILLSQEPGVMRLCREYSDKLDRAGFSSRKETGYCYGALSNGMEVTLPMRLLYREALLEAEKTPGKQLPPLPFSQDGASAFISWLNEPGLRGAKPLTRYLQRIYDLRHDLHKIFPDPSGMDSRAFINWVISSGQREHAIPDELMPGMESGKASVGKKAAASGRPSFDVDVVGYFRAELGVGEAARLLASGMKAAGVLFNSIVLRDVANRQDHPFQETGVRDSGAPVKILCVNGDATPIVARQMGPAFFWGCHTAGVWFWELEHFPRAMFSGFDFVDEIWVASEFVAKALRKVSPKPVFSFPLPVPNLPASRLTKTDLGLPEKFMFFFSFDFLSVFDRKNPIALVRAFTEAFAPEEGPVLVIKSINGDKKLPDLEKLRYAATPRRPDIVIIDCYLPHDRKDAMMANCDCYVSLHRSEGFGLTMAEAMSIAKPVVATSYGGNLEFMSDANSYLCGFRMCRVGEGNDPYPPETEWADPDIAEAASLMRRVYENPGEAAERGKRAQADVAATHSAAACARFLTERFTRIEKDRAAHIHAEKREDAPPAIAGRREFFDDALANLDALRSLEDQLGKTAGRLTRLAHPRAKKGGE